MLATIFEAHSAKKKNKDEKEDRDQVLDFGFHSNHPLVSFRFLVFLIKAFDGVLPTHDTDGAISSTSSAELKDLTLKACFEQTKHIGGMCTKATTKHGVCSDYYHLMIWLDLANICNYMGMDKVMRMVLLPVAWYYKKEFPTPADIPRCMNPLLSAQEKEEQKRLLASTTATTSKRIETTPAASSSSASASSSSGHAYSYASDQKSK